jgi:hypothetical protein
LTLAELSQFRVMSFGQRAFGVHRTSILIDPPLLPRHPNPSRATAASLRHQRTLRKSASKFKRLAE